MATLLLRLEGPLQSWGTQSRFRDRDTDREPSKSGVVGLLCAALGRPRQATIDDLTRLRMGVRVDREGVLRVDYHTAQSVNYAEGGHEPPRDAIISPRAYLSDASFLVGLSGDRGVLEGLDRALERPQWQLCLGRKAFPPGTPVQVPGGVWEGELEEVLRAHRPIDSGTTPRKAEEPFLLRFVWEDEGGVDVRQDVPLSFAERRFATRSVRTTWESLQP